MLLKRISLYNFRNFQKNEFNFDVNITVIVGENARGKTNLLESIFFLTNGVGFRESREEELILFQSSKSLVEGIFIDGNNKVDSKITLSKIDTRVEKKYYLNKTKKSHAQYLEAQTKAILFSPEQIKIITDSPDIRRSYFNKLISSYDIEYRKKLINFENAIRRRNKILEKYFDENKLREELKFWNEYLIDQAVYLTKKRAEYVDFLNNHPKIDSKEFKIKYLKNELNQIRLAEYFDLEKRIRRTMIGPQKDDFAIFLVNEQKKNIQHFGSRSEQRLGVIWLKINEVNYFEEKINRQPILLLDDIFSELDTKNRALVLSLIKKYQTILTTTEKEVVDLIKGEKTVINL